MRTPLLIRMGPLKARKSHLPCFSHFTQRLKGKWLWGDGVNVRVRIYVPKSLCSPISMFPGLCSPVSMFPGPMFPSIYVPHYLCSLVSMFPHPMFPSIYVPQYLCSPVPMFPSTYVPQYLCSPVPIFPIFHNKKLCDAETVISAIFTLSSVRMSVHQSKFSR